MSRDALIHYPFQLRPGVFVYLYLPTRITRDEVALITKGLATLVIEADEGDTP